MNEEQIKYRLINISKEEKRTFNDLLKQLALESLLYVWMQITLKQLACMKN
jgi:hypothetical protein